MSAEAPFLALEHVRKSYPERGGLGLRRTMRPVLEDICLTVDRGSILGLLGESGSGKSTLARLGLGLEEPDGGRILFDGEAPAPWRSARRGRISVVFQDYLTSVNPGFTVMEVIAEGLPPGLAKSAAKNAVFALMDRVRLPRDLAGRLPHQLSGGQLQRACIARALASNPEFIVFDEAVSALDVSIQAQILDLLRELKGDMTYLFITHDIQMAALLCDTVVLLHRGRIAGRTSGAGLGDATSPQLRRLIDSTILFHSDFDPEHPDGD